MAKKMKPGASPDASPERGDNSKATRAEIAAAVEEVISLKADRTGHTAKAAAVTKQINKVKTVLAGKGIPKRALNRILEDVETERSDEGPSKRREVDDAYSSAREAFGLPTQLALFDKTAPEGEGKGGDKPAPPPSGGNGAADGAGAPA